MSHYLFIWIRSVSSASQPKNYPKHLLYVRPCAKCQECRDKFYVVIAKSPKVESKNPQNIYHPVSIEILPLIFKKDIS